ncbi:Uncharacterised protein [Mycobacteroides abscessus subsp. abscessus]|nr:Uncharacterised protein [Mycobacteroides abscessus subsp. abscessus]
MNSAGCVRRVCMSAASVASSPSAHNIVRRSTPINGSNRVAHSSMYLRYMDDVAYSCSPMPLNWLPCPGNRNTTGRGLSAAVPVRNGACPVLSSTCSASGLSAHTAANRWLKARRPRRNVAATVARSCSGCRARWRARFFRAASSAGAVRAESTSRCAPS